MQSCKHPHTVCMDLAGSTVCLLHSYAVWLMYLKVVPGQLPPPWTILNRQLPPGHCLCRQFELEQLPTLTISSLTIPFQPKLICRELSEWKVGNCLAGHCPGEVTQGKIVSPGESFSHDACLPTVSYTAVYSYIARLPKEKLLVSHTACLFAHSKLYCSIYLCVWYIMVME